MEGVVQADGSLADLKISKSLDRTFGLNQEAIDAVRQWRFTPGSRNGVPVAVAVTILVEFRLPAASGSAPTASAMQDFGHGAHKLPEPGVSAPVLKRQVTAFYTSEAMRAKIMGLVTFNVVILPDGTVGDTQIAKSLDPDHGLDELASKAVQQWLFEPARLDGQPVPSIATVVIEFRLH